MRLGLDMYSQGKDSNTYLFSMLTTLTGEFAGVRRRKLSGMRKDVSCLAEVCGVDRTRSGRMDTSTQCCLMGAISGWW